MTYPSEEEKKGYAAIPQSNESSKDSPLKPKNNSWILQVIILTTLLQK